MASKWVGAVVGTFKVGDGTKVGPPKFQPDKPRMTLKGTHFNVNVVAMLKQVNPPKARMILNLTDIQHPPNTYVLNVSSTVKPSPTATAKLILRGKAGLRLVTPGRQVTGKPRMTVKGKTFKVNRNQVMRPGKTKLILRGKSIQKIGKAGLVPTVPTAKILIPTAVQEYGSLAPTPAYTDQELLVPTVEEFVGRRYWRDSHLSTFSPPGCSSPAGARSPTQGTTPGWSWRRTTVAPRTPSSTPASRRTRAAGRRPQERRSPAPSQSTTRAQQPSRSPSPQRQTRRARTTTSPAVRTRHGTEGSGSRLPQGRPWRSGC